MSHSKHVRGAMVEHLLVCVSHSLVERVIRLQKAREGRGLMR